jgi:hypothetical protein
MHADNSTMRKPGTFFTCLCLLTLVASLTGCGGNLNGTVSSADSATPAPVIRRGFLGAFFRPQGTVPFGVFSVYSKQRAPEPYPTPGRKLFGSKGYCDAVGPDGYSISSGYKVDAAKISHIIKLGVKWTRTPISSDFDDQSHLFGPGHYSFGDMDSAQCALVRAGIEPVIGFEAGSVNYNDTPHGFSPKELPTYKTAADFGEFCGAVVKHERAIFPTVHRYSTPGNEVNTDTKTFPGGDAQIASYTEACYHAIKTVQPSATIYGFELNTEKDVDAAAFVGRLYDLGCRPGACYDAIAMHLFTRYPLPSASTPCYPKAGGNYSMQCISDIQAATHKPSIHVLIGETAYLIPASVPDEATKAKAVVELMNKFAAIPSIDGVNYANVDECDLYPSGYFVGGCLVDSLGNELPAYTALQQLARKDF